MPPPPPAAPRVESLELVDDPASLQRAMEVRLRVFVDEQGFPAEEERDEHDPVARHVLGAVDGRPVATGRLIPEEGVARIGRMAVLAEERGRGWGRRLMEALEEEARRRGFAEAILDAQVQAMPFYARLGYLPEGPVFHECGVPHRRMRKLLHPGG